MLSTKKNNIIKSFALAIFLLALFYVSLAYELSRSFKCNIFNPVYYQSADVLYKILFCVSLVLIVFFFMRLVQSKYLRNSKLLNTLYTEKTFLIFMLISGFIFSILIPLYQIPDEQTHIHMIYSELGLNGSCATYFGQYNEPTKMIFDPNLKVPTISSYFHNGIMLGMPGFNSFVSLSIVRHLPQAIGLLICSLLGTHIIVASVVCEFLAVLFSSFVCYFALKLMPTRKLMFAVIMALPLCLQQNGSFSYDVVLNSMCFLLFAFIMNIKLKKEKFTLIDFLYICIMLLVIAITKLPYVFIGLTIFIIPSKKFAFRLFNKEFNYGSWIKYRKFIIPICISVFCLLVALVYYIERDNEFVILFTSAMLNFPHSIKLTIDFIVSAFIPLWKSYLWDFFWLDTRPSVYLLLFIVATIFVFNFIKTNKINNCQMKISNHIFIFIVFTLCFYMVSMSMVQHNLFLQGFDTATLSLEEYSNEFSKVGRILGLQGRYYIPLFPLLCFSFRSGFLSNLFSKVNYKLYSPIYFVVIFVYMLFVVITRFWI